ncbi:Gfo/Idh/MocA family oxidoreductase [uncultured Arcticibacterium sp.]|uniref:Gfo/Idh/MocA family protein n=1 Tax=uncultured Arcticibacterium sp. TaxID=2173042 RepID=UPI0030FA3C72
MKSNVNSRRKFLKTSALGAAGLAFSAKSYARIIGANNRLNMATAGLNGRGRAHLNMAKSLSKSLNVIGLIDPDARTFARVQSDYKSILGNAKIYEDFRKVLDNKDLDVLTIAAPDHWHAPMAILAMQAGKDVYLEKPCCHNPEEGYWLKDVVAKTGKTLQIGNQQRSAPTSRSLVRDLREGIIGDVYYAKAWYENNRGSIGTGKIAPVPSELNWDLWQGPAPRKEYKDNYVHYNWHWFWHWGTGEISNNGLHEMDIARYALGVDLPSKVSSAGGRFTQKDDWEFYDTQNVSFEFAEGKMLSWEGKSANGMDVHGRPGGRGTWIYGTNGTAVVDRGGYIIYDKANNIIKSENERNSSSSVDTLGITGMDNYHMQNFVDAIQKGEALNSPIDEAVKSTLLCHLGNMAQKTGKTLTCDTTTGKPNDAEAMQLWGRSYEKGWKPVV